MTVVRFLRCAGCGEDVPDLLWDGDYCEGCRRELAYLEFRRLEAQSLRAAAGEALTWRYSLEVILFCVTMALFAIGFWIDIALHVARWLR